MLFLRVLICVLLVIPVFGRTAIIVKVKGNRCFVHLEGAAAGVGDHFEALDLFGKSRGIIRLDKVKNGKAIATIISGTAGNNWILEHTNKTQLKSPEIPGSHKNRAGLTLSGNRSIVKKDIRETERYQGWSTGMLLFFDWYFHRLFSLNIAGSGSYHVIGGESSGAGPRYNARNVEDLRMSWFPHIQLSLKFHIPVAGQTRLWIGAGASVSMWHNLNDQYYIFDRKEFGKLQPAGQIALGMDIKLPKTKYTIPVSIGYSKVQWGGQWFDTVVLGKKPKQDYIPLDVSEITFHLGISQPI